MTRNLRTFTLKELEQYVRWLTQNRDTGVLTEVGRAHLANFDTYMERVRDDPDFFHHMYPAYANFLAGLTSPDDEQKRRFETFMSVLGEQTLDRARVLLEVLERGKRHSGRRKGSDNPDDAAIKKMRDLVASGEARSVRAASIKVAPEACVGGTVESTAKRLARKYRSGEK